MKFFFSPSHLLDQKKTKRKRKIDHQLWWAGPKKRCGGNQTERPLRTIASKLITNRVMDMGAAARNRLFTTRIIRFAYSKSKENKHTDKPFSFLSLSITNATGSNFLFFFGHGWRHGRRPTPTCIQSKKKKVNSIACKSSALHYNQYANHIE
jgi:hypothetical protein